MVQWSNGKKYFAGKTQGNKILFIIGYNYDKKKGATCPFSVMAHSALEKYKQIGVEWYTFPKPSVESTEIKKQLGNQSFPVVFIKDPDTQQISYLGGATDLVKLLDTI